jgi:hypothetical protein
MDSPPPTVATQVVRTCPLDRDKLILDVRLDLGDTRQLVQGGRDVLGTAVAGHGHGEESLFQVSVSLGFLPLLL